MKFLCLLLFVIFLLTQQGSSLRVFSSHKYGGNSNFPQLRTLDTTNSDAGSTSSSSITTGTDSDSDSNHTTSLSWFNQYLYYIISGAVIIILLIAIRVMLLKKRKNKDQAELGVELKSNKVTSVPASTSIRL